MGHMEAKNDLLIVTTSLLIDGRILKINWVFRHPVPIFGRNVSLKVNSSFGKTYPLIYDLHNVSEDLQLFSCNVLFLFSMHLSFFTLIVLLTSIILESST